MKIANKLKIALKKVLSLELGQVETDKAVLVYDGELAEGVEVFVEDENGDLNPAGDGEYVAEERIIVVEGGVVKEIREKEAEEEPAVEEEVEADEISEPAADPAEESQETEETESVEDRVAKVEGLVADIVAGIEKIINAVASLEDRIAAVENKISDLESPAATPAEEVEAEETEPKSRISYLRKN